MNERLITERQVKTGGGEVLVLHYFLLTECLHGKKEFGIEIAEQSSGYTTYAPALHTNIQRVYDLIIKLANGTVTPVGLSDVLADVLADWT